MAIIKIKFVTHAQNLLNYVMTGRGPGDSIDAHNCYWDTAHLEFEEIRRLRYGKGSIQAVHVMQSWGENESKTLSADEFNSIGKKLAEEKFPGHAFVVVTHTETSKTHNHIVVCPWHSETGKKIENKKFQLYELRATSDKLCQEKGLSVINKASKDREAGLPDVVQKMIKFNGKSYLLDLCEKADFARAWATNYGEYVAAMGSFGHSVRVEDKTITYFYPGKDRGKRGDKLGKKYDKPGLEKAFRENDMRYETYPELRDFIHGKMQQLKQNPDSKLALASELKEKSRGAFVEGKDYAAFTKRDRASNPALYPHELALKNCMFPISEIARARGSNIIEYCNVNKILLEKDTDGSWTIKGRPYVKLSEYEWINKKNRTRGSLIELVAAHKGITLIQAIADINHNPRLLLLESKFGEQKRTFTSFYIPSAERSGTAEGLGKVAFFLRGHGISGDFAEALLNSGQMQVGRHGVIRLFGKDDDRGAVDYHQDKDQKWHHETKGVPTRPFFSHPGKGREGYIFTDPLSFLKHRGENPFLKNSRSEGFLCLMAPDDKIVDHFINENQNIARLKIISGSKKLDHAAELDFFNNLKEKYQKLGVSVEKSGPERLPKGVEIDIPFHGL